MSLLASAAVLFPTGLSVVPGCADSGSPPMCGTKCAGLVVTCACRHQALHSSAIPARIEFLRKIMMRIGGLVTDAEHGLVLAKPLCSLYKYNLFLFGLDQGATRNPSPLRDWDANLLALKRQC
jgi:hypothetical protein